MKKKRFPGWTFLLLPLLFSCTAGSAKGTSDTATLYERAAGILKNLQTIVSLTTVNAQPVFSSRESQYHMEINEDMDGTIYRYAYDFSSHYYFHSHTEKQTSSSEPPETQDRYLYQNEATGLYLKASDNNGMLSRSTYTSYTDFINEFYDFVSYSNFVLHTAKEGVFAYLQTSAQETWAQKSNASSTSSVETSKTSFQASSTGVGELVLDCKFEQTYSEQENIADYHYVYQGGRFVSFTGTGTATTKNSSTSVRKGVFNASADYSRYDKSYPKAQ